MSLIQRASDYVKEVRTEASKVSWPNRKETQAATVVVIVAVAILAVYIFIIDQIIVRVLGLIIG